MVIQYSTSPYLLTLRRLNASGKEMNIITHTGPGTMFVGVQKLIIWRIATISFGTIVTQLLDK